MRNRPFARYASTLSLVVLAGCGGESPSSPPPTEPPTPTLALSLASSGVSVVQGGSASVGVSVARGGSFAGAVELTVDSVPAGVGVTLASSTIATAATSTTLAITVGETVAAGDLRITLRARGSGVAEQSATLVLTVTPKPATDVTWEFCTGYTISWFGMRDGDGAWKQVLPDAGSSRRFRFQMTADHGGIVYVVDPPSAQPYAQVNVVQALASELATMGRNYGDCSPFGDRTYTATVTGLQSGEWGVIRFGTGDPMTLAPNGTINVIRAMDGAHDLISTSVRAASFDAFTMVTAKAIVRRNVTPQSGSLGVLDFGSADALPVLSQTATLQNVGADSVAVGVHLATTNRSGMSLYPWSSVRGARGENSFTLPYLDPRQQVETDLHVINATAYSGQDGQRHGLYYRKLRTSSTGSFALGPAVPMPTISVDAGAETPFPRTVVRRPAEYAGSLQLTVLQQQTNAWFYSGIYATAAYCARLASGGSLDCSIGVPDLRAAAGWKPAWNLVRGQSLQWTIGAMSEAYDAARVVDGAAITWASRNGTMTP